MFLFESGEFLGKGHNAIVTDNGDGTVTKKYMGGHIKSCDLPFFEYCFLNDSDVFPKVYEIGNDYVIMEKLLCNTKKCVDLISVLDLDFHWQTVWEWACLGMMPRSINRTPELLFKSYVLNWCITCKEEMELMNSEFITWEGCDLLVKNIGEREDGSIVFFDI